MPYVFIEYNLRIVGDEAVKNLYNEVKRTGDVLTEIPELPGVCLDSIMGISKGRYPLNTETLENQITAEMMGETPTAVMFVRRERSTHP